MKRVTTILKQINELENELYSKYSPEEIMKGFEKLEKEGFSFSLTSLLDVIYTGTEQYLKLDSEFPDEN